MNADEAEPRQLLGVMALLGLLSLALLAVGLARASTVWTAVGGGGVAVALALYAAGG